VGQNGLEKAIEQRDLWVSFLLNVGKHRRPSDADQPALAEAREPDERRRSGDER
jgi:hypothetical protein